MSAALLGPGVYPGISFSDYHAIDAWGSSALKAMRRGPPARVLWEKEHQKGDTEATRRGHAAHCLLLTPELYEATYAHKPEDMSFATKDGKAWRDAHQDQIILTFDEYTQAGGAVRAILLKELVDDTLTKAEHRELSLLWTNPETDELCKGRPDWISGHWLYDLKVSRHAEGKSLAYRAYVEGWMHQLAHYRTGCILNGLDVRGGRLVVVTPKPPHYVYALEVKTDALDLLELENIATVKAMADCRKSGVWEDTPEVWQKIEPPAEALVQFGEMTFEGPTEEGA